MKKEFSIYLDLVRFCAAMLVVIYHSNMRLIIAKSLPMSSHGHAAVIVFFILSGYVISYITSTKEGTPVEYWSSRLSRFYSLAIPAVILALLLDLLGESLAPQFYIGKTTHDYWWLRILSSLTFTNELWSLSIMSFSNVPYWSLCYEMAYYVLFGMAMFTRGKLRIVLIGLTVLFLGPKIILLAPLWLLGVVLHRARWLERIPESVNWALLLASVPLYLLFQHYELSEYGSQLLRRLIGEKWHLQATFSRYFITDYLLALIIAANFVGFRGVAHRFSAVLLPCETVIRWLAGFTFSLYILHQPLLQFFAALINGNPAGPLFYAEVLAATLLSVILISTVTERKRYKLREQFRKLIRALPGASGGRPAAARAAAAPE